MAVHEFPLPDLGEGLTEGEILRWLVAEGDRVEQNQPIVEVETAKAAVEIPAKWPGTVVKIFHPEGATVEVGAPIVAIDTGGDAGPSGVDGQAGAAAPAAEAGAATGGKIGEVTATGRTAVLVGYGPRTTTAKRRPRKGVPQGPARPATNAAAAAPATVAPPAPAPARPASPAPVRPAAPAPAPAPAAGPPLAKPPVRKLARDLGVDLRTVVGTGPAGSITREDVQAAVAATTAAAATRPAAPSFGPDREQRIPIRGVRKLTAENVTASAFTAPHVTEFLTVDVTRSVQALERLKQLPDWQDARVSPLLLAARAVLVAIRRHPMINSTWDEDAGEIVIKEYVNLGIAAATERGLIVPNIKDAGRLTLRELADALTELVQTARA